MNLNHQINPFYSQNKLQEIHHLLQHAQAKVTFWGNRILIIEESKDIISLNELAKKILNFSPVDGEASQTKADMMMKLYRFYKQTEFHLNHSTWQQRVTKILTFIRELSFFIRELSFFSSTPQAQITAYLHTHLSNQLFLYDLALASNQLKFNDVLIQGFPHHQNENIAILIDKIDNWITTCHENLKFNDVQIFIQIDNHLKRFLKIKSDVLARLILKIAMPLVKNLTDGYQIESILETLKSIPYEGRASFLEMAMPLVKNLSNGYQIKSILKILKSIPYEERSSILEMTMPLVKGFTNRYQIQSILETLKSIPQEERASFLEMAMPLVKDLTDWYQIQSILETLKSIPYEERLSILEMAMPLVKDLPNGYQQAKILNVINSFSSQNRQDVIQALKNKSIDQLSTLSFLQLIHEIISEDSSLRESLYQHFFKQLQSTHIHVVRQFARLIFDHQADLLLYEEHPLVQEALHKLPLTENSQDPKNPYHIYQQLQKERADPTPAFTLVSEEIAGQKVFFNLPALQEKSRSKPETTVTFEQLPKEINEAYLQKLFDDLNQRLSLLEEAEKTKVIDYIQQSTEDTLSHLHENFVNDPYLKLLLSIQGDPLAPVPQEAARFFAVMKFISNQPNDIQKEELLAIQEDTLLKLSASIQNCPIGKAGGISEVYNALPSEYRYHQEKANTASKERALQYLHQFFQKFLTQSLSQSALLQELAETSDIRQLAHQELFLKNRVGARVGLQDPLKFDPHTNLLYNALIQKDLATTLETVFRHLTPKRLIQKLRKKLQRDLQHVDNKLYESFNELLSEKGKINYSDIWEMSDEDFTLQGLTENGALAVCLASEYLTS